MTISRIRFARREERRLSAKTVRRICAGMERDGAVSFSGLFSPGLLREIRRVVLRRHESGELRERGLIRDIGGRYAALLPFEGPFLKPEFYANPKLLAVVEALLGSTRCIGSLEAVISLPGSSRQHQHIDGPLRFDRVVGGKRRVYAGDLSKLPPYALGLAVPLCDVDEDKGPTALWLGSHRTALRAKPPGERLVARRFREERMTGDFGNAYLFDYRIFHGGLPNHSAQPRPLLMLVFTRAWFRDPNLMEVDPSVVLTRRNFKRIPERHRDLFVLAPASRRGLWGGGST